MILIDYQSLLQYYRFLQTQILLVSKNNKLCPMVSKLSWEEKENQSCFSNHYEFLRQ